MRLYVILVICVSAIAVVAGTELNSTHYYVQQPGLVATSSNSGANILGTGGNILNSANKLSGKFRSSFYPSVRVTTTPSPGGANPVWVVWGRQGTPFDQQNYQSQDFYQYALAPGEKSVKRQSNVNNYYDDYYGSNNNPVVSYDYTEPSTPSLTSVFDLDSFEDDSWDDVTSAQVKGGKRTRRTGIESLAGIMSLKGLKLSLIGGFYLFRGVIILAWRFLPWIFLLFIGLLFLPIPIITIPAAAGRTATDTVALNITDLTSTLTSFMEKLAESEECMERIACDIRRRNKSAWLNPALKSLIYTYQSKLPAPFQRMAKAYLVQKKCRLYTCSFLGDSKLR